MIFNSSCDKPEKFATMLSLSFRVFSKNFDMDESAAHAYAAKSGAYSSLTKWTKDANGNLVGYFELPLSVGIVGGVIQHHPIAKICTKILGISTANELSCIMAAVGLAQNFAAMRALVTEGIQKGHMKLHARKEGKN